jgi:proteasome lid subunit RPN8/RPN11
MTAPDSARSVAVSSADLARLCELARAARPLEACGLLLGRRNRASLLVRALVPLRNAARGAASFEIGALEQLACERLALARDLEVIGTWHSHADAPAAPSVRDESGAGAYPLALITSADGTTRAWCTREHPWREVALVGLSGNP